jgi:EAL domain-containing protein (putative c-di-GMP-specific phosphodiesterase class I)
VFDRAGGYRCASDANTGTGPVERWGHMEHSDATSSLELLFSAPDGRASDMVSRVLSTVRAHLEMDLAFVAQHSAAKGLVYRFVDGPQADLAARGIRIGAPVPLEDAYTGPILADQTPVVLDDIQQDEAFRALGSTIGLGIGSYVGVPLSFSNGRPYGVLACIRHAGGTRITPSEVRFLEALSRMLAEQIADERRRQRSRTASMRRIQRVLRSGELEMAYQPIVTLEAGTPVGVEALARFSEDIGQPPNAWFSEAATIGLGVDLELLALERALDRQPEIGTELFLAVNLGPEALASPRLPGVLAGFEASRIVLELTEHAQVQDYDALIVALARLRDAGARIAVDDAGAGYSSLQHILRISPDVIKLDITLTRDVDSDPVRCALAASLVSFSRHSSAVLVAEGVETRDEAQTLRDLGIGLGQGFLFAHPGPMPALRAS